MQFRDARKFTSFVAQDATVMAKIAQRIGKVE